METKKCSKCSKEKPIDEFSWKNKSKNRRASECKSCHKIMRKKYYENNKEREIERTKNNKAMLRIWYNNFKSTLKCERCDENHPAALEFHHLDKTQKEINIANAIAQGWAKERILDEIKKCIVLCRNCHAKEHWNEKFCTKHVDAPGCCN